MITLDYLEPTDSDRVRVSGRLGAANSAKFKSELVSLLDSGTGFLHLDLVDLEFIDSSGLSSLVALLKHARKSHGDVILYNTSNRVKSLLELTRLNEVFEMRDDEELPEASGFR